MKKIRILFIAVFLVFLGASLAWAPCGISGYVYCDVDQDGIFNNDDIPLEGVDILLDGVSVATTDENGMYSIESHELCDGVLLSLDETTLPEEYTNYKFVNPLNNDGVTYEKVRADQEPPLPLPQQDFGVYDDACVTRDIVAVKECVASGTTSDDDAEFKITITNKGDTDFTCEGPEIGTPISVPADDPIQTKEGIMVSPADDVCLEQDPKVINETIVICNDGLGSAFELPVSASCPVPCDRDIVAVKECVASGTTSDDDAEFKITITNKGDTDFTCEGPEIGTPISVPADDPIQTIEGIMMSPADDVCLEQDPKVINTTIVICNDGLGTAFELPVSANCPVPCDDPVYEGCTPGFWKMKSNSKDHCWCSDYYANPKLTEVYDAAALALYKGTTKNSAGFKDEDLDNALDFKGGGDLEGAVRKMLRMGTAALLNACTLNGGGNYPESETAIIIRINDALRSQDINIINGVKSEYGDWNEDLPCTMDANCNDKESPDDTNDPLTKAQISCGGN